MDTALLEIAPPVPPAAVQAGEGGAAPEESLEVGPGLFGALLAAASLAAGIPAAPAPPLPETTAPAGAPPPQGVQSAAILPPLAEDMLAALQELQAQAAALLKRLEDAPEEDVPAVALPAGQLLTQINTQFADLLADAALKGEGSGGGAGGGVYLELQTFLKQSVRIESGQFTPEGSAAADTPAQTQFKLLLEQLREAYRLLSDLSASPARRGEAAIRVTSAVEISQTVAVAELAPPVKPPASGNAAAPSSLPGDEGAEGTADPSYGSREERIRFAPPQTISAPPLAAAANQEVPGDAGDRFISAEQAPPPDQSSFKAVLAERGPAGKPVDGDAAQAQATAAPASHQPPSSRQEEALARMVRQSPSFQPPAADQVLVHIRQAVSTGDSKIQMHLEPAELGRVEVRMEVSADGKTGLVISADNRHALDALQRDARYLERALSDLGFKTDSGSLSFNLRGGQQQQAGTQGEQNGAPHYGEGYPPARQQEEEWTAIRQLRLNLAGGLDITI